MSRSYRKTPKAGIAGDSDKEGKRKANRACRRAQNQAVKRGDESIPLLREVSDVWSMPKDGKITIDPNSKYMRK